MTSPSDDSYISKILSMIRNNPGNEVGTIGNEVGNSDPSPIEDLTPTEAKTTKKELISFSEHGLLNEKETSLVSGMTIHALRKRRQLKLKPDYIKIDRRVFYKAADLESYLGLKIIKNSDT